MEYTQVALIAMHFGNERQLKKKKTRLKKKGFLAFEMIYMCVDSVLIHGEFQF